jgi:hypothetical protein
LRFPIRRGPWPQDRAPRSNSKASASTAASSRPSTRNFDPHGVSGRSMALARERGFSLNYCDRSRRRIARAGARLAVLGSEFVGEDRTRAAYVRAAG